VVCKSGILAFLISWAATHFDLSACTCTHLLNFLRMRSGRSHTDTLSLHSHSTVSCASKGLLRSGSWLTPIISKEAPCIQVVHLLSSLHLSRTPVLAHLDLAQRRLFQPRSLPHCRMLYPPRSTDSSTVCQFCLAVAARSQSPRSGRSVFQVTISRSTTSHSSISPPPRQQPAQRSCAIWWSRTADSTALQHEGGGGQPFCGCLAASYLRCPRAPTSSASLGDVRCALSPKVARRCAS
jgi:hypothetical protein